MPLDCLQCISPPFNEMLYLQEKHCQQPEVNNTTGRITQRTFIFNLHLTTGTTNSKQQLRENEERLVMVYISWAIDITCSDICQEILKKQIRPEEADQHVDLPSRCI